MTTPPDSARVRRSSSTLPARAAAGYFALTAALGGCAAGGGGARSEWISWALIFPVLTLGAALGAFWAARRQRADITRMAREAGAIDPGRLDRRLGTSGRAGLAQLAEELNRMLGRLEMGLAARDRFTSEVAHELKTPVSVLLIEAQVVARSDPDPIALARFVTSVEDEMRRLSKLIESFLTLARVEHGDAEMRRLSIDMNEIAMEAGEHCWPYANQRDLGLAVTLASDDESAGSPEVAGIPDLLRTMIENLLRNAIAISPRRTTVELRVARDNGCVRVSVRDHGPGVPESIAPRIFERFVTADHAQTGVGGSGIGLTIARGIAQVHGGEVSFRNLSPAEGGGAEFSARVPLLDGRPPAPGDSA